MTKKRSKRTVGTLLQYLAKKVGWKHGSGIDDKTGQILNTF